MKNKIIKHSYRFIAILTAFLLTIGLNAQIDNVIDTPAGTSVSSSGTTNYIPKWVSPTSLGNSSIYDNGNVGIGTTNPSAVLHVYESSHGTNFLFNPNELKLFCYAPPYIVALNLEAQNKSWKIQHTYNHELEFVYNGIKRIYFNNNGNVNITGKINANEIEVAGKVHAQEIEVAGKVHAQEIEVSLKAGEGADFVFEDDYDLKSLEEVERFIQQNNHLPDIPSATEMQENGLNIEDLQLQLLQKIEELTLYVIELKKELGTVKKQHSQTTN